jgi:predicted transcriptional regulator
MPGKRIQLDDQTWQALDLLARDSMKDFQELADEAFADLLRKHNRPVTLKEALRKSVAGDAGTASGPVTRPPASRRKSPRRR